MYVVLSIVKRKINGKYHYDEFLDTKYYDICHYNKKYLEEMEKLAKEYQEKYDLYMKENPDSEYKYKFFVDKTNMPGNLYGEGCSSGRYIPLKDSVLGDIIKDEHQVGSFIWDKYYGNMWDR